MKYRRSFLQSSVGCELRLSSCMNLVRVCDTIYPLCMFVYIYPIWLMYGNVCQQITVHTNIHTNIIIYIHTYESFIHGNPCNWASILREWVLRSGKVLLSVTSYCTKQRFFRLCLIPKDCILQAAWDSILKVDWQNSPTASHQPCSSDW